LCSRVWGREQQQRLRSTSTSTSQLISHAPSRKKIEFYTLSPTDVAQQMSVLEFELFEVVCRE